ncbi:alanyl-tRNA synthetase [Pelomyxa schiedti]|nr:alanyl-tRNA synthetase [Pelomyxa schiedti]
MAATSVHTESSTDLPETTLAYLADTFVSSGEATVLAVIPGEGLEATVILDKTWFYPGGGGQPCDVGKIVRATDPTHCFTVSKVTGGKNAHHIGTFSSTPARFAPGDRVTMQIDSDKRLLHAKLHTGGHLLDTCMNAIGYDFPPTKGNHYPSGAYVGYAGNVPTELRQETIQKLNEEVKKQITEAAPVVVEYLSAEEVIARMGTFPEYLSREKPSRFVTLPHQRVGYPCAGTHLQNLGQLNSLTVTKITRKSGETHVSYKVT